ncbi:hypothetical protein ACIRCZ_18715 [Leifsonia sp. NPDC102414]|uniref:hypothetical protein n=1 Tax=Leifsonia sp. NPDC102414 TaxID=3364124 RepID=UPI003824DD4E
MALTLTFLLRFRLLLDLSGGQRAFFSRRGIYPWLACGLGALAILTQGAIWPQETLDAPLGGANVLKLIQHMLTVAAFTLLVWNAIDLSAPRPPIPSKVVFRWLLTVAMQAALVMSFVMIENPGRTDYYFVENNQGRQDVWLFAAIYMIEMLLISILLLVAIRGHRARPYRWFRIGCSLVIAACLAELFDLCSSHIPALAPMIGIGRALFDPLFYPGALAIIATVAYFTTTRWRRRHHLRKYYGELVLICEAHRLSPLTRPTTVEGPDLAELATVVRDAHVGQAVAYTPAEIAKLNKAEEYLEREFGDLLELGAVRVTVVNAMAAS